jgi:hypothetical protein
VPMPRRMSLRLRFTLAYGLLALLLAGAGLAAVFSGSTRGTSATPVSPRALALVDRFLHALQTGDKSTACQLFDALPGCTGAGTIPAATVTRLPAEATGTQVDVPVIIDGQYALIALVESHGRYRIDDIVADPTIDLTPPFAA